jgi:endo-1,4-beta-xylanase
MVNATDIHFINDYGLEGADQKKCLGLIAYVNYIESKGAKVDGIGTQMHVTLGAKLQWTRHTCHVYQFSCHR